MDVFDTYAERYDRWYDEHAELYRKELEIIRRPRHPALEVGVGTGRFCAPLNIDVGIDISRGVLKIARKRCEVVLANAELMPFRDETFATVYFIFTICFLRNPLAALREAHRVLKDDGMLIACVIPRDSGLGRIYASKDSPFYRIARFYTERELEHMFESAGFDVLRVKKRRLLYSDNDFVCYECGIAFE